MIYLTPESDLSDNFILEKLNFVKGAFLKPTQTIGEVC